MRRDHVRLGVLTALFAAAVVLPQTVYEPCFGDHGELQLCGAVAGIAHPPGHAGICLLGRILTLAPGIPPAAIISFANALAGIFCLWLLLVLILEAGASGPAALVAIVTLGISPPFWRATLAPEVYAPCLALLGVAGWLLRAGARRGGVAWSVAAAFVLAYAVATRPSLASFVPGFVLGGWWARPVARGRSRGAHRWWPLAGFILGMLICIGYLWLRDTPHNPYNYIARHPAMEASYVQAAPGGEAASARRIAWLLTGRQFAPNLAPTPHSIAGQARWLWGELDGQFPVIFGAYALVILGGAVAFSRRTRRGGAILALWAPGAVLPLLLIQQRGDAAMTLPLLCLLAFCGALGLSTLMTFRPRVAVFIALLTLHVLCRWWTADERYLARPADVAAGAFLREHRAADVPPDAVLLARWREAAPLLYELRVTHDRPDVDVIDVTYRDWRNVLRRAGNRPVLAPQCTQPPPDLVAGRAGPWLRLRLPAEEP